MTPARFWRVLPGAAALAALALPSQAEKCERAAAQAEQARALPPGLLRAIGLVESGRVDPASGVRAAWPWSVNSGGAGRAFASAEAAAAFVAQRQAAGVRSLDVGCFQVNLLHHPRAFPSLQAAFDPDSNARAAASFLAELRARLGGWEAAVAAYHSSTPDRGTPYRQLVYAAWQQPVRGAPDLGSGTARIPGGPRTVTFPGSQPTVVRVTAQPAGPLPRIIRFGQHGP